MLNEIGSSSLARGSGGRREDTRPRSRKRGSRACTLAGRRGMLASRRGRRRAGKNSVRVGSTTTRGAAAASASASSVGDVGVGARGGIRNRLPLLRNAGLAQGTKGLNFTADQETNSVRSRHDKVGVVEEIRGPAHARSDADAGRKVRSARQRDVGNGIANRNALLRRRGRVLLGAAKELCGAMRQHGTDAVETPQDTRLAQLTLVGLTLRVEQITWALSRCGLGVTRSLPATKTSTSSMRWCSSSARSRLSRSSTVEMATWRGA